MNNLERSLNFRRSADEKIKAIQADNDLTEAAKAARISDIRQHTNDQMSKLQAAHQTEKRTARESLHSRLFGLGFRASVSEAEKVAMMTSYRDAQFRADALKDSAEALRVFSRAQMTGDKLMMKALAAVSYENGWTDVLDSYASTNESIAESLQELRSFEDESSDLNIKLGESVAFSPISETKEEATARISVFAEATH
jgi:selenocysteine-specific translation elongation factor